MGRMLYYQYFVEGENEEKLLKVLKTDMGLIEAGKIQKFNVVQEKITNARLMSLKEKTIVVLVFDTDTGKEKILRENIARLEKCKAVKEVLCITQVENLEDELIRSCSIKNVKELTGSLTDKEFKHDFIKDTHLAQKLRRHKFDIEKLWIKNPTDGYKGIVNEAKKIKKK